MRSSSDTRERERESDRPQTEIEKRDSGHRPPDLYIVGIGPGDDAHISPRAMTALTRADTVVGYTTYIDLIRPLIPGKPVVSTAMQKEVERVEAAIRIAREGRPCAIVSSGDPGIYAMAGLVFEICQKQSIPVSCRPPRPAGTLAVEVVPGIPALAACASLLGAPLTHDFAAVSLSDLLTPWSLIEKRLHAAGDADFVIVLYNPKSRRRKDYLEAARRILLKYRDHTTPVGVVTGAMRDHQRVSLTTLEHLHAEAVDMQTTVIIGNRSTFRYGDAMITPRGYAGKYDLDGGETP